MTTTGYICCMYCNIPLVNDIENNDYLNRTDQPIGHSFQNGDWMCSKCYELYKIKKKCFLFHEWRKWETGKIIYQDGTTKGFYQTKVCERCGKIKYREIL